MPQIYYTLLSLILVLFSMLTELMLLGFISLLLTVFQRSISRICIPSHVATHMLPCKRETAEHNTPAHYSLNQTINNGRRLLSSDSTSDHCRVKVLIYCPYIYIVHFTTTSMLTSKIELSRENKDHHSYRK